jgi:hypothetical protein
MQVLVRRHTSFVHTFEQQQRQASRIQHQRAYTTSYSFNTSDSWLHEEYCRLYFTTIVKLIDCWCLKLW